MALAAYRNLLRATHVAFKGEKGESRKTARTNSADPIVY